jgi:AraC-like DNA-binding protein
MKICQLNDLYKEKYILTSISAIHQTPTYKVLDNKSRIPNGFILIDKGECVYKWKGQTTTLQSGDIIYLPHGSKHKLTILSEQFSFYRIDFNIKNVEGEEIVFSLLPEVMLRNCEKHILDIVIDLTTLFHDASGYLKSTALLYELFDIFSKTTENKKRSAIAPAVEYIKKNYTIDFDCDILSKMCLLSKAQMYRIFKNEIGLSPIEYKNSLRILRAKTILKGDICTISETAFLLGFESVYYFSRTFKQITGISPKQYKLSKLKKE